MSQACAAQEAETSKTANTWASPQSRTVRQHYLYCLHLTNWEKISKKKILSHLGSYWVVGLGLKWSTCSFKCKSLFIPSPACQLRAFAGWNLKAEPNNVCTALPPVWAETPINLPSFKRTLFFEVLRTAWHLSQSVIEYTFNFFLKATWFCFLLMRMPFC